MKLHPVCQLFALSLCWVYITGTSGTYVPGQRCRCPQTQNSVRGQLANLTVIPSNPDCDRDTVIVTLRKNNAEVCVNPESRLGRMLRRCWKRATELGSNVRVCLKRRRKSRPQHRGSRRRNGGHKRKGTTSPNSS